MPNLFSFGLVTLNFVVWGFPGTHRILCLAPVVDLGFLGPCGGLKAGELSMVLYWGRSEFSGP